MSNPHGNHRLVFNPQNDNISANERKAISTLKHNSEINLKKADKGTTTVIMDTAQKIQEGSQQYINYRMINSISLSHLLLFKKHAEKSTQ